MNITKTGILNNNLFIEKGFLVQAEEGWSYVPAANGDNKSISGPIIDLSMLGELEKPTQVNIELDFTWGDFSGSENVSNFVAKFQGANRRVGETGTTWSGTQILASFLNDTVMPDTLIKNNLTGGTYHYNTTGIISAAWLNTYSGARLGFKVNYRKGTGAVSISNVKITFGGFEKGPFIATTNEEYTAANEFYEY